MRIIIPGSNGMLGRYIQKYFELQYEVIPLTRKNLDLAKDINNVEKYFIQDINLSSSDIVINAAGVIKQRDYNAVELISVNSIFPNLLSKLSEQTNAKIVHITTDCVFSGNRGNYIEKDLHDCVDDYGKSKSLGENPNNTNIRTSIIGEELFNKKSLIEWVKSNKNSTINGFSNHFWNGVTCLELAKFIEILINENNFWKGTKHLFSPESVSKYQLVNLINDVYNLDIKINKIEHNYCNRLLNSQYDLVKITSLGDQLQQQKEFNIF